MEAVFVILIVAIVAVVVFDFTNGFHDASNMIATLIASRAMTPAQAVILVGFFTFLGPLLGGTAVADTIGKFVDVSNLGVTEALLIVTCGIFGAIAWNLITWWIALPSSSSHALLGGLIGAVLIGADTDNVVWGFSELTHGSITGVAKVLITLFTSPLIGFLVGFLLHRCTAFILRGARPSVNRTLCRIQWFSAAILAFSHGTNDAQKGMGIIAMMLVLAGMMPDFHVPFWVILISASSLTLGTLMGGWSIVKTVGYGIYRLRPHHGMDAQLASSVVIFGASLIGGPVSTTHVVSTSIMGIGASERPRAVRWSKAGEIAMTWVLTIPGSGLLGGVFYAFVKVLSGLF